MRRFSHRPSRADNGGASDTGVGHCRALINAQGKGLATQYGLLTIGTRTLPSGDRQIATNVPPAKGEYYIRKVTLSG